MDRERPAGLEVRDGRQRDELAVLHRVRLAAGNGDQSLDLAEIRRDGESTPLIDECKKLQNIRNDVVHKGLPCDAISDAHAIDVAVAVYEKVVRPVLWSLDLTVVEQGQIERRRFT